MVPTFTCGLLRSNFSFAIILAPSSQFLALSCQLSAKIKTLSSGRRFPLHLGNDLFRDRTRRLFIAREVHGVLGAALGAGTHVGGVTEHFRQRHDGLDDLRTGAMFHALDASTART